MLGEKPKVTGKYFAMAGRFASLQANPFYLSAAYCTLESQSNLGGWHLCSRRYTKHKKMRASGGKIHQQISFADRRIGARIGCLIEEASGNGIR